MTEKSTRLWLIKKYIKWCIKNDVVGAVDVIGQVNISGDIDRYKESMIGSPDELQEYLDTLFRPDSEQTIHSTYRAFLWMIYMGISDEDICNITADNVDFINSRIIYHDKEYKFPVLATAESLSNCVQLTAFNYYNDNYNSVILRKRLQGDMILRGVRGNTTVKSLKHVIYDYTLIRLRSGVASRIVPHKNISSSGCYYRIWQAETKGFEPDFVKMAIRENPYNGEGSVPRNIRQKRYRSKAVFKHDYELWKHVFNY